MSDEVDLHNVIDTFLHKLEALHEVFPLVMLMTFSLRRKTKEDHQKFLQENGSVAEETEEFTRYDLPTEHLRLSARLSRKGRRASTAHNLLPRNFLVSYVSEYDAFLGELIKQLLLIRPEIMDSSEKNISLSDLIELGSVEAARTHLVEKQVESVLRKNHTEQFSWLEKTFSIPLKSGLNAWPIFIELTERRNLFVHCDGIISTQYLQACARNDVGIEDLKVGDKLQVSKSYLNNSYDCLYEIGIKLAQVLWRKLKPDEIEKAEKSLSHFTYELLVNEKYSLAINILKFAISDIKKWGSEESRRVYIINLAIAYKNNDESEKATKTLDDEDWSACGDNFQICVAVLKDDFENSVKIMKRIGNDGVVKETDYLEWPAFKCFREEDQFKQTFIEVFGKEPILTEEIESIPGSSTVKKNENIH